MPTNIVNDFKNPENKPLKDLYFNVVTDDGVKKTICALDKHWAPRSIFSNYQSLVVAGGQYKTGAALQEWQHEAENFKKDLEFLLGLKHHEFFSYMVFQKHALNCIKSFLQNPIPSWLQKHPSLAVRNLYNAILQLAIDVILRLVANKQLTIEDMQQISRKLLTPHMLLDLLLVVGNLDPIHTNILKIIFSSYMFIEPKHKLLILAAFNDNFQYIKNQTFEIIKQMKNYLRDINYKSYFDDVAYNIMNFVFILKVLLEVCRPLALDLYKQTILLRTIMRFFEKILPFILLNMKRFNITSNGVLWLKLARDQLQQALELISFQEVKMVKSNL